MKADEALEGFRRELDTIDAQIVERLARRFQVCRIIADYKRENGIDMMQPHRIEIVKQRTAQLGAERGLSPEFLSKLYGMIIQEACRVETDVMTMQEERIE